MLLLRVGTWRAHDHGPRRAVAEGAKQTMTDDEVRPYVGKPVRVTMDDGRVLAGTLHAEDGHGHGHSHYAIVSDPVREGGEKVAEVIHGAERINVIEDASDDPAAVE